VFAGGVQSGHEGGGGFFPITSGGEFFGAGTAGPFAVPFDGAGGESKRQGIVRLRSAPVHSISARRKRQGSGKSVPGPAIHRRGLPARAWRRFSSNRDHCGDRSEARARHSRGLVQFLRGPSLLGRAFLKEIRVTFDSTLLTPASKLRKHWNCESRLSPQEIWRLR